MPSTTRELVSDRVRALAAVPERERTPFGVRIERGDDEIELAARRRADAASPLETADRVTGRSGAARRRYDQGRPRRNLSPEPPGAGRGRVLDGDRELGYHRGAGHSHAGSQHGAGASGRDARRRRRAGRVRTTALLRSPEAKSERSDIFRKVLIANRGEIALRINRACQELGVSTVAIFSEADRDSLHVRQADEAFCVGPGPAGALLSEHSEHHFDRADHRAATRSIPATDFLAENARFAEICGDHGLDVHRPEAAASSR